MGTSVLTGNGLSFSVEDTGGNGPTVLLLHGFPDSAALWRNQIPKLVAARYRVIAPDLRGFGSSDRPGEVENYRMELLVGDVLSILDALEVRSTAVVGHDWGSGIGWALAGLSPERVTRFMALSVGHPSSYFTDLRQRELSWYMLFFQFIGVAEEALRRNDWALLREWTNNPVDIERYVTDLDRPGALTAALNYYRANVPPEAFGGGAGIELPPVTCPVLGVWSDGDMACGEAQMLASGKRVSGPWRYKRIRGAGHWIPLDAPEELSNLLLDFLVESP
ncbi:alpha/beta fold hydrolase [Pseudonocardia kunmingensis]|uniref:Pimeloyl-ACP methyl ester carboxylesterase n=1 Tax=Pseudonocardia kunmingensis TaxID=630975 RepID=A0A543DQ97_9PSEU|nr:alpha/beta hydrolase [Pseudonocardia kunmingensis]TQM11484.1 pimeloyl-ACP methyl ester carboxylesterase [Pseudonocardia kunmingensis]